MRDGRFAPGSTTLYAVLWLAVMIQGWSPLIDHDAMLWLEYPKDSANRKTSRDLELAEAISRAPESEQRVLTLLYGSREEALQGAIETQRQALAFLEEQGTATREDGEELQILLAEVGESREGATWEVGLEDWYADALERQRAVANGEQELATLLDEQIFERGIRWKQRSLAVLAANFGLILFGAVLVLTRLRALPELLRGSDTSPPWSFEDGLGVFVRGDFWNRLYFVALSALWTQPFGPALAESPLGTLLQSWGTLLASLPLLWLIHRHLLAPASRSPVGSFGMDAGLRKTVGVGVAALALDLLGTHALSWASWGLGVGSSWAEGFDETLVWGSRADSLLTSLDYVVWAPALEELAFRGVLYYSLRGRLGTAAAALASAGVFAGLHFYSLPGFLMTLWSGLVWALAFERARSLLPGIAAHAAYNALYVLGLVLLYR